MDRKTFAVISHPDAGKTTLTEKFLLFGGAIMTAGAVKSNKITKTATSDFMEIEKQRGISVATSVMGFEYGGVKVNLLDTPGHRDFAEDTYRTLTAVDSVILVIDSVKGIEEQTKKLMEVCRTRDTPVIVFVNKMDRPGKDPFDIMDELEDILSIKVCPMTWPINSGQDFKGVFDLYQNRLNLFAINKTKVEQNIILIKNLEDPKTDELLQRDAATLRRDVELIRGVYDPIDLEQYHMGIQAPVFFGSALNNFGVREMLDAFVKIAPNPQPRSTTKGLIQPDDDLFSGFVFKIHANLDPRHRDRIAFLRICSGKFQRNTFYYHVRRSKKIRFSNPTSFMAREKSLVEEAFPGDVIGLYDSGDFKIGDTLSEGQDFNFKGIPSFAPEILKEVINLDPTKTKQLSKGIEQLTDEGVAQLFTKQPGNRKLIGTVGELQYEVIQHRLMHEYGAKCEFQPISVYRLSWVGGTDQAALKRFMDIKMSQIVMDKDDNPVLMVKTKGELDAMIAQYPTLKFRFVSEEMSKQTFLNQTTKIL